MSGLREVLAAHHRDWGDCCCSEYVLEVPYDEHLESAVLDWLRARLASDEVREAVAEVLSCGANGEMTAYSETARPDHNRWSWRGDGHAPVIREQYLADADAALAAVLAALEVER